MKFMASITYRLVNDYMIPNLTLPPEESAIRLGKWGMLHKDYLEKHNPTLFFTLLIQGSLYQYCNDIENQAWQMFDNLVEQMEANEGVTAQLKGDNQLEWVCRMQNIKARVSEIVCKNIINL